MSERSESGEQPGQGEQERAKESSVSLQMNRSQLDQLAILMRSLINEGYFHERLSNLSARSRDLADAGQSVPTEDVSLRTKVGDQLEAAAAFIEAIRTIKE